jgi:hypothetical protein
VLFFACGLSNDGQRSCATCHDPTRYFTDGRTTANDAPEQDLDLASVWPRLRDLRLRRVEVFTMTRGESDEWKRSLGTLAEIVASTGGGGYGG